ncbi:hypothetical protein QWY82_17530 [Simiduia curdlanivorans]|uniref:Uncharacterized protein n=1 Tax=Simiduia curdlanivorans TaxID=1492769 RepID=A0ABV8V4Y9_9GAMM|nr:hypothetical protein [Simiduia curdlanivorans]MDN3640603.1 hypothetical protein [Simiduia curdlanivorans]
MDKRKPATILQLRLPPLWCNSHQQILTERINALDGVELLAAPNLEMKLKCRRPLSTPSFIALEEIFAYYQFDDTAYEQLARVKDESH